MGLSRIRSTSFSLEDLREPLLRMGRRPNPSGLDPAHDVWPPHPRPGPDLEVGDIAFSDCASEVPDPDPCFSRSSRDRHQESLFTAAPVHEGTRVGAAARGGAGHQSGQPRAVDSWTGQDSVSEFFPITVLLWRLLQITVHTVLTVHGHGPIQEC